MQSLKTLSKNHDKPIIFIEFGYRSIDFSGRQPWHSKREEGHVNEEA